MVTRVAVLEFLAQSTQLLAVVTVNVTPGPTNVGLTLEVMLFVPELKDRTRGVESPRKSAGDRIES
jgi:hypothetical protein